jgi:hypothetical protein
MYPEKWRRSLGKLITDCWVINGTVPHWLSWARQRKMFDFLNLWWYKT